MIKARPLPRYIQISEALIRDISAGVLIDGARLPTEKQMAIDYNVSVGTLRKSLVELEKKDLLKRVQGSGNYICFKQNITSIYALFHLELLAGGGLPTAKILSITPMLSPQYLPFNQINKTVSKIIRLRYLDDILIALEEIWVNRKMSLDIEQGPISESLYEYYKQDMNLIISHMEDKISFKPVPAWSPDVFDMRIGEMAGYIERVAWNQHNQICEFSKTWFNPIICHYVNRT